MAEEEIIRKIPVFSLFVYSIKNFWFILTKRLIFNLPLVIAIILLEFAVKYFLFHGFIVIGDNPKTIDHNLQLSMLLNKITSVIAFLLRTLLISSAIANWCQFLLRDVELKGFANMKFDKPVWKVFGLLVLYVLIGILLVTIVLTTGVAAHRNLPFPWLINQIITAFFETVIGLTVLVVGCRLLVKIPASALGKNYSFEQAWKDTAGNLFSIALMLVVLVSFVIFNERILGEIDGSASYFFNGLTPTDIKLFYFSVSRSLFGILGAAWLTAFVVGFYRFASEKKYL